MKKIYKKNDLLLVIAGDHKGKKGKLIATVKDGEYVVIENINVKKDVKRNPQDGTKEVISREFPIHISNVKLVEGKK